MQRASAQVGRGASGAAAQAEPAKDTLGRETRGAVLGFIAVARQGNNAVAALYLDTDAKGEAGAELARKLYVVLDNRLPPRLNELSDSPEGSSENPLRPDQNVVGTINVTGGSFDVVVERIGRGTTPPVWLFSRKTLTSIPEAYAEVNLVPVERFLPNFISRPRIAGIRVFEWFALLVVVPVFYRLLRVLDWAFRPLMRWWHRRTGTLDDESANHVPGLVRLVLIAIAIRWSVANLDLPLLERQFWSAIATILTITAFGWALLLLNGYGEAYIQRRFGRGGETASLLRLGRRRDVLAVSAVCAGPQSATSGLTRLRLCRTWNRRPRRGARGPEDARERHRRGVADLRRGGPCRRRAQVRRHHRDRGLHRAPVNPHSYTRSNDSHGAERPDCERRARDAVDARQVLVSPFRRPALRDGARSDAGGHRQH